MYYPTLEEVKKREKRGNIPAPSTVKSLPTSRRPVSAFLKINRGGYSFLLESVEGGEQLARYSFIGTEPHRVLRADGEDKTDPSCSYRRRARQV